MDSIRLFNFIQDFIMGAAYMGLVVVIVVLASDVHTAINRRRAKPRYRRKGN